MRPSKEIQRLHQKTKKYSALFAKCDVRIFFGYFFDMPSTN